ncbi:hypothetical protein F938_00811 [Acinetobacter bereziniae LMG 1003 = CIP 70.12]|uniref:Uncharacterized protein n=1 Tax=Acinetobacter bereziniae LMG 1003 = CIP 70.12 TaxID=981324 RepID=N9DQK1_ACIBZ|nr:hypothetical protein [Acinetobacter bereziniae]ENW00167.1 hypothetical protein F938_00811 [Acinetobacter bereziniae LMG 1003 = CIP 70.12]
MDDLQNQGGEETQTTEQTQTSTETTTPNEETQTTDKPTETKEEKPNLPESADKYEVTLEGFDFESFKADESNKSFLENAHKAGISNEQLGVVLEAYDQHTAVQLEQLQTEWGGDFDANIRLAQQAVQAAGLDPKDVDSPTFGIRLAAYYGKALQEDMPPLNTQQSGTDNVSDLIASEAYMNESHPDHKRVYAQVLKHYAKLNQ